MKEVCSHCYRLKECTEMGRWRLCNEHKSLKQYQTKEKKQNPLKRTKLNQISKPQSKRLKEYSIICNTFKVENPKCTVNIPNICTKDTTDVHHAKGKIGSLLTNTEYFVATCRECHRYIEESPEWAKENGYSLSRL